MIPTLPFVEPEYDVLPLYVQEPVPNINPPILTALDELSLNELYVRREYLLKHLNKVEKEIQLRMQEDTSCIQPLLLQTSIIEKPIIDKPLIENEIQKIVNNGEVKKVSPTKVLIKVIKKA